MSTILSKSSCSTKFYLIMQLSTCHFMAQASSGRGYTHKEFCSMWVAQPRLFSSPVSASRALAAYLRGKHESNYERCGEFGEDIYQTIEVIKGTMRDPKDYVVVPARLEVNTSVGEHIPPSKKTVQALEVLKEKERQENMAKMNLPIFKIQRPYATNDPEKRWFIYGAGRTYSRSIPESLVPQYLKNCMGDKYKIFMYVRIREGANETTELEYVTPVNEKDWPEW